MLVKEEKTDEGLLRYHGAMGPVSCQKCEAEAINLIHVRSGNLLMRMLNIGTKWLLRCTKCGDDVEIPYDQTHDAKLRGEMVEANASGALDAETFHRLLHELSIPALSHINDQSSKWDCPECSESNPENFSACWQCGEEHPAVKDAPAPEQSDDPQCASGGCSCNGIQSEPSDT